MKLLCLTTLAIGLGGATACLADDLLTAGHGQGAATAGRPELVFSDYRPSESTLLPQINAVLAALMAKRAGADSSGANVANGPNGPEIELVEFDYRNSTLADARSDASAGPLCKHMAPPGSRIMRERCFYEAPGEAALNDYQFQEEIEQMREQNARDFLEVAEYGLAYRRSLAEQQ